MSDNNKIRQEQLCASRTRIKQEKLTPESGGNAEGLSRQMKILVCACVILGMLALTILILLHRGKAGLISSEENQVVVFALLLILFFALKHLNLTISDRITLNFGFIFIPATVLLFGPWSILPLILGGVLADTKNRERAWVVLLNFSGDILRIVPGILIFQRIGGWFGFDRLTPGLILSVAGFFAWFFVADIALLYFFRVAWNKSWRVEIFPDMVPYLLDLCFSPVSILAVLIYTRMGAPYILMILIPFVASIYIYRYAVHKKTENIELIKLNEKLKRLTREKTILFDKASSYSKKLKKAHSQLLQSEKLASVGKLAGGVAHELNTPLGAIMTNAEFALSFAEDEDIKESLELIKKASLRCKNITGKLLQFSRKEDSEKIVVSVSEIIESSRQLLKHRLDETNTKLIKKIGDDVQITGNPDELSSVFTNLIQNALDAIESGSIDTGIITVEAVRDDESIKITIRDNGCGMDDNVLNKIFDPFFTTRDVGKGTGLGLWLSMNIISKHGGKIYVKSKPGEGSEFIVVIPRKQ